MGLREQINQRPGIGSAVIGAVVILLLIFIGLQVRGPRPPANLPVGKSFYTSDDGHTWFTDDADKVVPYQHDSSTAVRCRVFKCSSSAPFAGYLEAYTQDLHDEMTGVVKIGAEHPPLSPSSDTLVKRPGDKTWVLAYTPEGRKITDVRCPDGSAEKPQPVLP